MQSQITHEYPSVTQLDTSEEIIAAIYRDAERAAAKRIDAHAAAKAAATSPVEQLAADLAALEAEQSDRAATRKRIEDHCAAEQAKIDTHLEPLRAEFFLLVERHDHAEAAHIGHRRDILAAQRRAAGRPLVEFDETHPDWRTRELAERIAGKRQALDTARKSALSVADLEKAVKGARFKLQQAHGLRDSARAMVEHHRAKLAEAHGVLNGPVDATQDLAELVDRRDALQADAFISERPVDAAKLKDLNAQVVEAENVLNRAKQQAEGARAALAPLEVMIDDELRKAAEDGERIKAAEIKFRSTLADLERRLIADAEHEHQARLLSVRGHVKSFEVAAVEPVAEDL